MSRYHIGIDFGTTNCTVAFAESKENSSLINQLSVPQMIAAGTQGDECMLPSFIYFPLPEELKHQTVGLEWAQERSYCVGKFAKERGAELPTQLISSAKSWLCHAGIDRRSPLLPVNASQGLPTISPLQACADLLSHLKEAWEQTQKEAPFHEQNIFITVPASFDPSARQLILEAAELAKYPSISLLEEPQAAFYAWLHASGEEWRNNLKAGDHLLVIDIGGGTTDFSLISIVDQRGDLELNRTAVGAHLLLGGDNLDLSLAHLAKSKFEEQGHEIDDWQMQAIIHASRTAKEILLGDKGSDNFDVTIMGRGSRLIGGSLTVSLTREEVQSLILDGFFPLVSPIEQSKTEQRVGIQQLGLPYAQDPRITCQLAKFLSSTGEGREGDVGNFIVPKAVLFNGGTTKAYEIRKRLLTQLNQWATHFNKQQVVELPNADYDFAVSRGAVYYGLARAGKGIRIKSGTSRSYYIGIEDAAPAVPGRPTPLQAFCVAPFGMEEGSEETFSKQQFSLILGERAYFRFFSRSTEALTDGTVPSVGTVVKKWKQELTELHPVEAVLDQSEDDGKTISVHLKSKVTELGILELWCVAADGRSWKLEFDIRHGAKDISHV